MKRDERAARDIKQALLKTVLMFCIICHGGIGWCNLDKKGPVMFAKLMNFVKRDIWRIRLKDHPRSKSFAIRLIRIIVLAFRGFDENKCRFRASALTFYSLLSIVPVIALMFGIAKGFGLQERMASQILEKMKGHEEVANRIIAFANSLLDRASGGVVAGIGVVFLFWTIISLLGSVEGSFNDIWGVVKPRTFGRKFSDYLITMLVCPILLVVAGGVTVFLCGQIQTIIEKIPVLRNFGPVFWYVMKLLPYITVWVSFTFIFIFMPNTKVRFVSGLIAGIVAGALFQFVQWAYVNFQVQITTRYAIYGSFAALPLFLLWLQMSWLIVLFGAEVSFAHQNVETYEFEPDCLSVSKLFKKQLSLLIVQRSVKKFCNAEKPVDARWFSHELEIPIRLVRQILYELSEAGVLSEVGNGKYNEFAYQPAVDVEKITIKFVIDRLEQYGTTDIPVAKVSELDKLSNCLRQFGETIEKSPANVLLKDL
ncbi:MAG: YihY/virulence factor BrkB family protein [Phycisphaerae bacterium]|nr:YihY/virulence factor BrkB family protein [Phycisphaerae bacterium]MDD5381039.1 YihY/virulence factor BrkB family protein [Phycisphaerae bacterium]